MLLKKTIYRFKSYLEKYDTSIPWSTRMLRRHTGITAQDLWRLEKYNIIPRAPRDRRGQRIWKLQEMRKILTRLDDLMNSHNIAMLCLKNDKYLRRYGIIGRKRPRI